MFSVRRILITLNALIILSFLGCKKDSNIIPPSVDRLVEGTVFEDCNGNVSKEKRIYLKYSYIGCFGGGLISTDSTETDYNGHFIIHYKEFLQESSTTSYNHILTILNTSINLCNPIGNYDLYPNDTTMNVVINLKFHNTYTSTDTFYFKCSSIIGGQFQESGLIQFFTGPFHDTSIVINAFLAGNVYKKNNEISHSGFFKWGIGINRLSWNGTGQDGYFYFTHQPCALVDTVEYYADPN